MISIVDTWILGRDPLYYATNVFVLGENSTVRKVPIVFLKKLASLFGMLLIIIFSNAMPLSSHGLLKKQMLKQYCKHLMTGCRRQYLCSFLYK